MAIGNIKYSALPLRRDDVVDHLVSTAADLPLSANQGRILNEKEDKLVLQTNKTVYVDAVKGDDTTGDGTRSKPWATIQKAADECPIAGSYTYQYAIYILTSGSYGALQLNGKRIYLNTLLDAPEITMEHIIADCNAALYVDAPITINVGAWTSHGLAVLNSYAYVQKRITINGIHTSNRSGIYAGHGATVFLNTDPVINNCSTAITCSQSSRMITGTLNGTGNAIGIEAHTNGIMSYGGTYLDATTKYKTRTGGRIILQEQGWVQLGTANKATPVSINRELYTEFLVCVQINNRDTLTTIVPSNHPQGTCGLTGYASANTYWYAGVGATNTTMYIKQALDCGVDCINTGNVTLTVYGRRA